MSKTQFILLVGFVGFYALILVYLLTSAGANLVRAKRRAADEALNASTPFVKGTRRNRAQTRAVWREGAARQEVHLG